MPLIETIAQSNGKNRAMKNTHFCYASILFFGCQSPAEPNDLGASDESVNTPSDTGITPSPKIQDCLSPAPKSMWGEIIEAPAQTFFSADLSDAVRQGIDAGLLAAAQAWGNYGPVEYWVLGTDTDAALELIDCYCERRDAFGQWSHESCVTHHSATDGEHNLMSYLLVGQQAVEDNIPMGSMGLNGNRDWGIHTFTSSYPFGFDGIFEYIEAAEETKTVFHEYFHAVQSAHIYTKDYQHREALMGPTWFVEGGAEYMADYTTSRMWSDGTLLPTPSSNHPSFEQRMEWRMIGGKENLATHCPNMAFEDITYQDPCSYAAYELGAWAIAYLHATTKPNQLLEVFYPNLEALEWETAFETAFGVSPESFYEDFDDFLSLSLADQMAILPN